MANSRILTSNLEFLRILLIFLGKAPEKVYDSPFIDCHRKLSQSPLANYLDCHLMLNLLLIPMHHLTASQSTSSLEISSSASNLEPAYLNHRSNIPVILNVI